MDAIDPSQFADTPTGLIVGQQRLYLDRGQAPLDLAQLADVRTRSQPMPATVLRRSINTTSRHRPC